jgi:hypothetical protein
MDEFKEKFIEIFNEKNILTDSSDVKFEENLLELNLRIFDYVNNKIPIVLNEDLNCEHTMEFLDVYESIDSDIDLSTVKGLYEFIYRQMIKHIDEEIKLHKKLILCIFVYSINLHNDYYLSFYGNFKFK